jgi:perosamine synthetase
MQAAVGLAQVEKANYYRSLRIQNNNLYRQYLKKVPGIIFQTNQKNGLNVNWMNAILIDEKKYGKPKKQLMEYLKKNGIDTRLLFTGLHKQKCLKKYGCNMKGNYKETEKLTKSGFYLPSSSDLQQSDIKHICSLIEKFAK